MKMMHHHHQQYLSNLSPTNNNNSSNSNNNINIRPQQQSSPSDQSMSTATPPQQISRASPASTALVMSSNNINGQQQPSSRQLTPNTSSSNNGTGSSSNGNTGNAGGPPNPMIRQFACHAKSMSAGVVVPVPGISNHLAPSTGMNQNNAPGHHNHHHHHHHRDQSANANHQANLVSKQQQMQQQHQQQQQQQQHHLQQQTQQAIRDYHQRTSGHLPLSQHQHHHSSHNSQPPPLPQQQHQQSYNGSSNQLLSARQAMTGGGSSSIILSNNNINNIHNRSASTHLSSVVLNHNTHHHNHHTQSNHHMNHHHTTNSRQNFQQQHQPPPHVTTNSIWSIDENISKSHGKLAASSSYIPHAYLFNPSITDMSCDNVSNASRLIDGAPAPGYYLPGNLPNSNGLSVSGSLKVPEFLPICDLMFNLISMIIYFCENTFGIIALIALYYHSASKYWALAGGAFVFGSNFICQYLSFNWLYKSKLEECRRKREAQEELEDEEDCERRYYNRIAANMRNYQCGSCTWLPNSATEVQLKFLLSIALDASMHIFCLGFLVRYIKLVIPVTDTARVKREARDLCMLRMTHGFVQSAPLLLVQAYMICSQTCNASTTNLSATSAILSLINVSWALASFTKYARKKYMHKFVLTWLGIMSQLLWRLGTVSSRVVALTIYAVYYNYWMLVVLSLHWITMFLWFIKPGNLFRDEANLPPARKVSYAMATAWIYCFCYMNFEEHNSKLKMTSYYLIMFLENNLLLTVCLIFSSQVTWFKNLSILVVYLGFVFGMLFMFLYYKYFHVTVLNNGLSCSQESIDSIADQLSAAGKKIAGFKPGTLRLKSDDSLASGHRYNTNISASLHTGSHPEITRTVKPPYLASSQAPLPQSGVFNCKLNTCSKKQKIQNPHIRRHNQ